MDISNDTKRPLSQIDDLQITITHVHGFEHCFEPSFQFECKTIVIN
jgi:hypothetical protein